MFTITIQVTSTFNVQKLAQLITFKCMYNNICQLKYHQIWYLVCYDITCPRSLELMPLCCLAVMLVRIVFWKICPSILGHQKASLQMHFHTLVEEACSVALIQGFLK